MRLRTALRLGIVAILLAICSSPAAAYIGGGVERVALLVVAGPNRVVECGSSVHVSANLARTVDGAPIANAPVQWQLTDPLFRRRSDPEHDDGRSWQRACRDHPRASSREADRGGDGLCAEHQLADTQSVQRRVCAHASGRLNLHIGSGCGWSGDGITRCVHRLGCGRGIGPATIYGATGRGGGALIPHGAAHADGGWGETPTRLPGSARASGRLLRCSSLCGARSPPSGRGRCDRGRSSATADARNTSRLPMTRAASPSTP
jgi:hypothetical protein